MNNTMLSFVQELRKVISTSLTELQQSYKNLYGFLKSVLFVNILNENEETPTDIIRIDRKKLGSYIGISGGQTANFPLIETEMIQYLEALDQRLAKLKLNPQPKQTFIDRYGALIYFSKVIVLIAIFITYLNIVAQLNEDIKRISAQGMQSERAELNVQRQRYKMLESKKEQGEKELMSRLQSKNDELEEKKQEVKIAQGQVQQLHEKLNALQTQGKVDQLQVAKFTADLRDWETSAQTLKKTISDLSSEVESLKGQLQSRNVEISRLNKDLDTNQTESKNLLTYLHSIIACVDPDACTRDVKIERSKVDEIISKLQDYESLRMYKSAYVQISQLFPKALGMSVD